MLNSINILLAQKASADELGFGLGDPVLNRVLESQLDRGVRNRCNGVIWKN